MKTTYSVYTDLDLYCTKGIEGLYEAREIAKRYAAEGHDVEIRDDVTGDTVEMDAEDEEEEKEMMEYYTMESFGADCPANWEEIATWLNAKLTERVSADMDDRDIREIADAIWEAYWGGEYAKYDAPAPSEELWGEEEDEDEEEDDEMETNLWYAVMRDLEDSDWGTGSYDLDEARAKVAELREDGYTDAYIAVIDMHNEGDPVCVEEIRD